MTRVLSVVLLLLAGFSTSCANDSQAAGRKDCQFAVPPEWVGRTLNWDGACKAGKADGSGVLRAYGKDKTTEIFFGQMRAGQLAVGVMEVEGGYKAGNFVNGAVQDTEDRNILLKAFDVASAAAKAYSERLKQAGNAPSAKLYAEKAEELAQQMD